MPIQSVLLAVLLQVGAFALFSALALTMRQAILAGIIVLSFGTVMA